MPVALNAQDSPLREDVMAAKPLKPQEGAPVWLSKGGGAGNWLLD